MTWALSLINYLRDVKLREDDKEAKKVKFWATRLTLIAESCIKEVLHIQFCIAYLTKRLTTCSERFVREYVETLSIGTKGSPG